VGKKKDKFIHYFSQNPVEEGHRERSIGIVRGMKGWGRKGKGKRKEYKALANYFIGVPGEERGGGGGVGQNITEMFF